MKKLSKEQLAEKTRIVALLNSCKELIEAQIEVFNAKLEELKAPVLKAIEQYNSSLNETEEFIETTKCDLQNYYDEQSEMWQESDAGQSYYEWLNEFDGVDFSEKISFDFEPFVGFELKDADNLDAISDAPE